eukprot:scaffold37430_cov27-Prasinocladus_malaysianus.AAC.1
MPAFSSSNGSSDIYSPDPEDAMPAALQAGLSEPAVAHLAPRGPPDAPMTRLISESDMYIAQQA